MESEDAICEAIRERQTVLHLSFRNLTEFSARLTECTALQELFLVSNRIQVLPPTIGLLKALRILDVRFNLLVKLPEELCNMSSLEELNLSSNKLVEIPGNLGRLVRLTRLDLRSNQITHIPVQMAALDRLVDLQLDDNPIVNLPASLISSDAKAVLQYLRPLLLHGEPKHRAEEQETTPVVSFPVPPRPPSFPRSPLPTDRHDRELLNTPFSPPSGVPLVTPLTPNTASATQFTRMSSQVSMQSGNSNSSSAGSVWGVALHQSTPTTTVPPIPFSTPTRNSTLTHLDSLNHIGSPPQSGFHTPTFPSFPRPASTNSLHSMDSQVSTLVGPRIPLGGPPDQVITALDADNRRLRDAVSLLESQNRAQATLMGMQRATYETVASLQEQLEHAHALHARSAHTVAQQQEQIADLSLRLHQESSQHAQTRQSLDHERSVMQIGGAKLRVTPADIKETQAVLQQLSDVSLSLSATLQMSPMFATSISELQRAVHTLESVAMRLGQDSGVVMGGYTSSSYPSGPSTRQSSTPGSKVTTPRSTTVPTLPVSQPPSMNIIPSLSSPAISGGSPFAPRRAGRDSGEFLLTNPQAVIQKLKAPSLLVKFPLLGGKPHGRRFAISADGLKLEWGSARKEEYNRGLPLADVQYVVVGPRTSAFRKYQELDKLSGHSRCFSLVCGSRTLDLQAANDEQARMWVIGLQEILVRLGHHPNKMDPPRPYYNPLRLFIYTLRIRSREQLRNGGISFSQRVRLALNTCPRVQVQDLATMQLYDSDDEPVVTVAPSNGYIRHVRPTSLPVTSHSVPLERYSYLNRMSADMGRDHESLMVPGRRLSDASSASSRSSANWSPAHHGTHTGVSGSEQGSPRLRPATTPINTTGLFQPVHLPPRHSESSIGEDYAGGRPRRGSYPSPPPKSPQLMTIMQRRASSASPAPTAPTPPPFALDATSAASVLATPMSAPPDPPKIPRTVERSPSRASAVSASPDRPKDLNVPTPTTKSRPESIRSKISFGELSQQWGGVDVRTQVEGKEIVLPSGRVVPPLKKHYYDTVRKPTFMIKYPFHGGEPEMRLFTVDFTQKLIKWGTKLNKMRSQISFADIRYIVFGANTKTMKGRKGKKYQIFPWRCFSIVLNERTVDVQATSDEEAQQVLFEFCKEKGLEMERQYCSASQLIFKRARMKMAASGLNWVQSLVQALQSAGSSDALNAAATAVVYSSPSTGVNTPSGKDESFDSQAVPVTPSTVMFSPTTTSIFGKSLDEVTRSPTPSARSPLPLPPSPTNTGSRPRSAITSPHPMIPPSPTRHLDVPALQQRRASTPQKSSPNLAIPTSQ